MLRQGQFGCHLVGGAITGLWKGDNGITCFRNRLENLMYIFLVPALIIFLLVGIGDLIKSCSRKIFSFLKSLFSKILLACNEVGCKCIHINSYLYVIQHYAVKSCILRVLAINILWAPREKTINLNFKAMLIKDIQVLLYIKWNRLRWRQHTVQSWNGQKSVLEQSFKEGNGASFGGFLHGGEGGKGLARQDYSSAECRVTGRAKDRQSGRAEWKVLH